MTGMAVIEVQALSKRFGRIVAVDRLSFDVPGGTIVGFLGPNGAGKTTTLRMLLGLIRPDSGTATIHGHTYQDLIAPLRQVGAALDASGFHPGRTARRHLRIHALAGAVPPGRVEEVLGIVGLEDAADRRVGGFSFGMRQRLSLGTAILHDPEVLILDEPTNGLDPDGVRWLRDLLRDLATNGHTVLVSSHLLAEVAQTVDSVIILNQGRLVTAATLADLAARTRGVMRIRTPRPHDLSHILANAGLHITIIDPDRIEVTGGTTETVGTLAAAHGIPIFETYVENTNLEDAFLSLTATNTENGPAA